MRLRPRRGKAEVYSSRCAHDVSPRRSCPDIIFREIELYKRKAHVPVIAVMMDVAASGGYYVALAADTIVAHPTTVTGSIGVIMVSANAEGLMQKLGLAANTIKSGEHKDMGSP